MRRALVVAAILLLALAAGAGAARKNPILSAARATAAQQSEHIVLEAHGTFAGQPLSLTGSGDLSNDPQVGSLTVSYIAAGKTGTAKLVLTDGKLYVSADLLRALLPAGKSWLSLDLQKASALLPTQTPAQLLTRLKSSAAVKDAGAEQIEGVATEHYTATLGKQRAGLTGPVDVWVDGQGLVRRVHVGAARGASTLEVTLTFSNYGEAVTAAAPPASQTVDGKTLLPYLTIGGKS